MRIGIFTDTYPPYINGVSTSIAMLENALKKQGHEVFIVTVNPDEFKIKKEKNIIRVPGIPTGIYDYRLTGIYPLKAVNQIKKWKLDVIHSHTEFGVGTFARLISKQFNIPLVHTYHTMYEDYVHYITKGYFNKSSKKLLEYLTKFYCDKTATELIVPTEKTALLFKEKYKFDKDVNIVPTGIEIERFFDENIDKNKVSKIKKDLGLTNSDFINLFVGRIGEEKSIDTLIEGQVLIKKKHPNSKLVIVGDGPDKDKYYKLAKNLKLEKDIIFTGKVPWEEVPLYYNMTDVFSTASNTETQGLTVLEAMAASKPVVCLNDEAFLTVIRDKKNGLVFNNRKEYQSAIITLIEDPVLLNKLGMQGRIDSEPYSAKYFADNVVKVYEKAIGEQSKKKSFLNKILKR